MNRDRFRGLCRQAGGRLQEQWGRLTGDPQTVAAGTRERLIGRVQEQHGLSKQAAERQMQEFISRNRDWRTLSKLRL